MSSVWQSIFHPTNLSIFSLVPLLGYYIILHWAFIYFSGIRKLAKKYRCLQQQSADSILHWQSCRINWVKNSFNMDIGVSSKGLYLKNAVTPALQIPWDKIERLPNQKWGFVSEARFRLGDDPSVRFSIYDGTHLAKEINAYKPQLA